MTEFIVEVSSNHNGDLARALKFVDIAKQIGASGIKFQLFDIRRLFAPEALRAKPELLERVAWQLPVEFIPKISAYCKQLDIKFGCTPFDLDAIEILAPHVDFFKIASYQIPWLTLLEHVNNIHKPTMISFGMADVREIDTAVNILNACKLTLLHCVSSYPARTSDCNLNKIAQLLYKYPNCRVGWSDHSVSDTILYNATLRQNASAIEFHLDLDGKGFEYSLGHCWLPEQIAPVINNIRRALEHDGNIYAKLSDAETRERLWRSDPSDGLRPILETRKELVC